MPGLTEGLTDHELIHATLGGDRSAFGVLVYRYQEMVINVVYRMCGDPHLAEDAAQEAFIKAWQNLHKYNPDLSFKAWINRIAINKAIDVLRRSPLTIDIDMIEGDIGSGTSTKGVEDEVERKHQKERIQRMLLNLPEAGRAVLVLREYQCLSYQEIAEVLNIPVGTVMSRLNYVRGLLRKQLMQEQSVDAQVAKEMV